MLGQIQQLSLVLSTTYSIREQVGGLPQQLITLDQNLMGKALIWRAIATALKLSQDGVRLSGRTDTQQSEVIDGQVQQKQPS